MTYLGHEHILPGYLTLLGPLKFLIVEPRTIKVLLILAVVFGQVIGPLLLNVGRVLRFAGLVYPQELVVTTLLVDEILDASVLSVIYPLENVLF